MRPSLPDRMQRTLAVLAWLAVHHRTTVAELADRFGVSRGQMETDLEQANQSGYGPDPEHMLSVVVGDDGTVEAFALHPDLVGPTRLSRPEAFAVLVAGRAALELDPSLDALRSAMTKLAGTLGVGMEDVVDVDLGAPECLAEFRTAVDEHRSVQMSYWSMARNQVTERTVDPLYVFFRDGSWYARGLDHPAEHGAEEGGRRARRSHRAELRLFRLDRVMHCELTHDTFIPPARIDTTDAVLNLPADSRPVTIRFPATARWAADYLELHDGHDGDDGSLTGVLDVNGTPFLDQWLVRTRAEVLDPPDLRDRPQVAAAAILRRYE